MLRTLRAFAWMRWRMTLNAFEKTGGRDRLERVSMALEQIGPVIALLLLVPTALMLAALGAFTGFSLARGETPGLPFAVARYLLLAVPILALVGPFLLPAADRTNPVRLLLLPIPRSTLYVAQSSSAFGDPWNVLAVPLIFGMCGGLFAGGAGAAGVLASGAGLLLVLVLVGLSSLAASLLHLIVRDRRRGELVALLLIVVLPAISLVPSMLSANARRNRAHATEARDRRANPVPERILATALALAPTEMFVGTAKAAAQGATPLALRSAAGLGAWALLLNALGFITFGKVLESPGSSGGKRGAPMRGVWTRRVPGLSAPASAVALAQLRLALRTPRGRSILISPLVVFLLFGVVMLRNAGTADLGPFHFTSGIGLATMCSFFSIISVLPISMNQFAIDRAGLTLALLSPLREEELLAGKAVGNALIVGPPALLCIVAARAVFPGDPLSLWLTLLLGLAAMYAVAAPIAAIGSAMFPRVANLNSIGRGGNPHGLANFIGMVTLLIGGGIPLVLSLAATRLLERPALAPLFVGAWLLVALVISRVLFVPAIKVFRSRRENLAMLE